MVGVAMKVEANFSARLNAGGGAQGSDAARFSAGSKVDPTTQATIAQTTAKAVQEALARVGASTVPPPSARVAVDASVLASVAGGAKSRDAEKLDTVKLDAIKAKIQTGDFEIDYAMIASQLALGPRVSGRR
jgi:anti-sigma28 factor (negative regulator of flagellin synthesis)